MIYLDNAATSPVHPDVLAAMQPYLMSEYGNASSIHTYGRRAKAALDKAREQLATFVGARPAEITFTSGGTEAIHTALFGAFLAAPARKHIITTAIEHHAVLHTCDFLQALGGQVTIISPRDDGRFYAEDFLAAMRPDTLLVSIMSVNNETGAVLPVLEVANSVKEHDASVLVHSDTVQALGTVRMHLDTSPVDFASFSAHKVYGPKGVGALYMRSGTLWKATLYGGAQERERRAGTENVAGISGFGTAVERLSAHWDEHVRHLSLVRSAFWNALKDVPGVVLNSPEGAVPSILNVWFEGIRSDILLMRLDLAGVSASAGSACTAGSLEPSHVLESYGYAESRVRSSLRFSFSEFNTVEEVLEAARIVREVVGQLRR